MKIRSKSAAATVVAAASIALASPAQAVDYVEGLDVDIFTAAVDALGQPTRDPFTLDAGENEFVGTILSPNDGADFIPVEVLAGYTLIGLTVVVDTSFDFGGTSIFFSNLQGGDVITNPLASFSTSLDLGPNLYGILLGNGVVGASYNVTFDVAGPGGPSGSVPEPSTWALLLLGFCSIGFAMRRRRTLLRVTYA